MTRLLRVVCVALLAVAAAAPLAAQERLSRRVSLDLKAMAPPDAFKVLADAVGLTAKVDPAVTTPVDILVRDVRARTALDTMCDSIGCAWSVAGGVLVVRPASAPDVRVDVRTDRKREALAVARTEARTEARIEKRVDRRVAVETVERIKAALKRTLPADMKFENVPLETASQRLSEALGIRLSITSDDPDVRTLTIDLSNQTLLLGLKELVGPSDRHVVWTLKMDVENSTGSKEPSVALRFSSKGTVIKKK